MKSSSDSSYKSIVKSSAVFGGTQIFLILINLIRGKAIAYFLGPTGMGISSLLTNTTTMIQQFTLCGVNLTAVKDVSQAEASNERASLLKIITYVRLLVFILALVGLIICLIFAEQLSRFTFGNTEYVFHFRVLSIFIFMTTIANGELSILQGTKKIKKIAFGNIIAGVSGLLVGIPFYYYWGINGIVPGILGLSLTTMLFNLYLNKDNLQIKNLKKISFQDFSASSKRMISLGAIMMIATLLGTFSTYLLNVFITKNGSVEDLGYFQSANSLTNQYIGLVFTAMSIDYFPKLAAVSHNKKESNELINNQLEIVLLFVAPIIGFFMLLAPFVVNILLTQKFLVIVPILQTMALGVFFKAASYPLGYISFAKGDKKVFFWMEGVFSNALQLVLNITFYMFFGLKGLGYSFIIIYVIYFLIVSTVVVKRYVFAFKVGIYKLMFFLCSGCILIFVMINYIQNDLLKYVISILSLVILSVFSVHELDKRIGFINAFLGRIKK